MRKIPRGFALHAANAVSPGHSGRSPENADVFLINTNSNLHINQVSLSQNSVIMTGMGKSLQTTGADRGLRGLTRRLKGRLACWLGMHRPLRTKVRRDGLVFRGRCKRCGVAVSKIKGESWTVDGPND
jgi:hypothetical protein